jgi:hypothetical protein
MLHKAKTWIFFAALLFVVTLCGTTCGFKQRILAIVRVITLSLADSRFQKVHRRSHDWVPVGHEMLFVTSQSGLFTVSSGRRSMLLAQLQLEQCSTPRFKMWKNLRHFSVGVVSCFFVVVFAIVSSWCLQWPVWVDFCELDFVCESLG